MPAPSIPIQGWQENRRTQGRRTLLALAAALMLFAAAGVAGSLFLRRVAPVECVGFDVGADPPPAPTPWREFLGEPQVHRETQPILTPGGPVPLAPGYGTQPPLKRRRTGGGRRDRRRRRARREGPPAIVNNVARADGKRAPWRQIAREARQRAERAEMRHLELDRDLLAAQAEWQDLIGKLAKGAEEALRLERQLSDAVAQVESLRLDDEAHRQHWQQMHDQMQEQRRRAEQAEVERDAAQARIVELLGEGQELRQTHAAAATTTARRLISEARNLTGWRDDTAEGSSVAVTATDRPDPPRAIRLLITRPAPTHETIQCLFKWIGGISLGETHRVLVDLCNMGRIVNRGLPWGYRLVDEAAVHMEPPAPLGTTPGEDQHDADMRAEEAHDFGETRCRRCNRHRLDAAAPCVRA